MGQVPQNTYLIVGSGKLARHLGHYFHMLNVVPCKWSRNNSSDFNTFHQIFDPVHRLEKCLEKSSHVLLAVSDHAIIPLATTLPKNKILLHFSGALMTPLALGAHPLMTFSHPLYDLATYKKVSFIMEKNRHYTSIEEVIPQWQNPTYLLEADKKHLYHALCVMSGNFTNLLWREVLNLFENELHLPMSAVNLYLETIFKNIQSDPYNSLTGPLTRGDRETLINNEEALTPYHLNPLYREFVKLYEISQKEEL